MMPPPGGKNRYDFPCDDPGGRNAVVSSFTYNNINRKVNYLKKNKCLIEYKLEVLMVNTVT